MGKDTAYFVRRPSTISDLRVPHLLSLEKEYDIVKTIQLSWIDYDAHLCSDYPLFKCLYVKANGHTDGILIIPDNQAYVKFAAYYG